MTEMTDIAPAAGASAAALAVTPNPRIAARSTPRAAAKTTHKPAATGAKARIGGDHIVLFIIEVAGVIGVALAAFTISATSLLEVATWQHYPEPLHFLTVIMTDLPVVVFTTVTITFKWREQRVAMWLARAVAVIMTAYSATANFLHTVSIGGLDTYQDWVGATFNGSAPILVLVCTEFLGHILTRPKSERGRVHRLEAEIKTLKRELRGARRGVTS